MTTAGSLLEDLRSNDKLTRVNAIRSLGQNRTGAGTAVPDLIRLLDDPDTEIASLSLRALALIGPNMVLKPKIIERLRDPCPAMRRMAAFAIGGMGTAGLDAIPLLASLLKDEDVGVQMYALLALSKLSSESEWAECLL
jgi:HEAT repeat protein